MTTVPTADVARGATPAKAPVVAPERAPSALTTIPNYPPGASAPVAPQTLQAVPTGPRTRLILQAQSDSWADVRDGHGNRLLYETISAGRTVAIEGVTPLSVFLGNVDGVRVQFNGQPYDVSRHKRGEVARFTLGETAGAR
jgi:cytoskeleton protein RodZ